MKMTDKNREMLNSLVRILRQTSMTKQEVMSRFDVPERTARDMISEIAKRVPVIALSDSKGYRIAVTEDDIEDAKHAFFENRKRSGEIEKRNKPLIDFLENKGVKIV